jgi:hypothetical protein
VIPTFGKLISVDTQHSCFDSWALLPHFSVLCVLLSSLKSAAGRLCSGRYLAKWVKKRLFSETIDSVRADQNPQP